MCGIFFGLYRKSLSPEESSEIINTTSHLLHHRGPDNTNSIVLHHQNSTLLFLHTRLHIIGNSTPQPITNPDKTIYLIINGEIFNWKELSKELDFTPSQSDCEIIIPLYQKYIQYHFDYATFFSKLNGQFSFVLYDSSIDVIFSSRDHIGITPLYYGYTSDNSTLLFSSELKCIHNHVDNVKIFPPRKFLYLPLSDLNFDFVTYKDYYSTSIKHFNKTSILKNINKLLTSSVHLQLSDLLNPTSPDFGVLLSGGLDSSLIASIISRRTPIKTFSIGLSPNSPDLLAARKVADYIHSDHYEFLFTPQEGLDAIKDVIWYTETYDITTIRASVPMYLLTKKIKQRFHNIKVLFSGELSDELFSYLYGGNSPSLDAFQLETISLVSNVHKFDCLRANKTCMANSFEVRVPFTDPIFIDYILSIDPFLKSFGNLNPYNIEKQLLRESFPNYIPVDILWRRKEAFSDGVSNFNNPSENWIDNIISFCNNLYSNLHFHILSLKYNTNTPSTKEQLFYRETFSTLFHNSDYTVRFWLPKWCGLNPDPSARKHIKELKN